MGVGRTRKTDKHLPRRVYLRHGQYWFVRPDGRWIALGRDLATMYRSLAGLAMPTAIATMADVLDRYSLEILPRKAPGTQKNQRAGMARLRAVFGKMRPGDVKPWQISAYRDRRKAAGLTAANHDLELLKHVCRMAVEWGAMDENPAREVTKLERPRRTRYVTDAEFRAVRDCAAPMLQIAMDLAVLTGLRRGDLLKLSRSNLTDDGILVETGKTGKALLIEWSEELRAVIDRAKALPPQIRPTLLCNLQGRPYTADGFSTNWDRAMARAMKAGVARFRFHDLRAKSSSDDDAETATQRLGHHDRRTTERYYRRKPTRVRPLR